MYFFIMTYPCQSCAYYLREIVMIITKYNIFATAILWEKINNDTEYSSDEMLQWYIRKFADPFCNR